MVRFLRLAQVRRSRIRVMEGVCLVLACQCPPALLDRTILSKVSCESWDRSSRPTLVRVLAPMSPQLLLGGILIRLSGAAGFGENLPSQGVFQIANSRVRRSLDPSLVQESTKFRVAETRQIF